MRHRSTLQDGHTHGAVVRCRHERYTGGVYPGRCTREGVQGGTYHLGVLGRHIGRYYPPREA